METELGGVVQVNLTSTCFVFVDLHVLGALAVEDWPRTRKTGLGPNSEASEIKFRPFVSQHSRGSVAIFEPPK